jgi:hypothetical protein
MPLRLSEVSYAMKNGKRTGSVINVESIRRSVHLIPKFNKPSQNRTNAGDSMSYGADDMMEKHSKFFLNSFLSVDTFQFADGDYELVDRE